MKQLRINVALDLPDDAFAQAELLGAAKPVVEAFRAGLRKAFGHAEVVSDIVSARPRSSRVPAPPATRAGSDLPA